MRYPNVLPHDMPKQLGDHLFVVHGSVQMAPLMKITRNMGIIRHDGKLTLINPVRMSDQGLAELEALGTVSHVLRLGAFHGMDDGFYVDRYNVPFWSFAGGITYTEPAIDEVLQEGGPLPFPDATLLKFGHMKEPEGVLLLKHEP